MVLTPGDVGRRVVVRRRLEVENGRQQYGDVLGVLERWADGALSVRRRDGALVEVPEVDIVAGKPIPPAPVRRPPDTGAGLALVSAIGWPAVETQALGDWLLQAADGFTTRPNSVVPGGLPGVPLDAALETVRAFYAERGLPARIQTVVGTPLEDSLRERGWTVLASGKEPYTLNNVMVASLADLFTALPEYPASVEVDGPLDDEWLTLYGRTGVLSPAARHVLTGGGSVPVALARLGDPLIAIGRGVVTGPWLGVAAVEVAEHERRKGYGLAIMAALARWGAELDARWSYLQVSTNNAPALAMYERLGYRVDHQYSYYAPPA